MRVAVLNASEASRAEVLGTLKCSDLELRAAQWLIQGARKHMVDVRELMEEG